MSLTQQTQASMNLALAHGASLGQGLFWHAAQARWWWTDCQGASLSAWSPASGQLHSYRTPDRVGALAPCRSGRLLLGLAKRLGHATQAAETAALQVQPLVVVDALEPRTRINEGRTDRRGFFVFGTMNEDAEARAIGSFYQFSHQHGLRRLALPAVVAANSICFSVDGRTLYFADGARRQIWQCDYNAEAASVGQIRPFAETAADALPAGAVVDRDGCLWSAQRGAGRLVCYGADGRQRSAFALPVKHPTCPAFGGPGQNVLTVITARYGMAREELLQMPQAGSLFSITLETQPGLPDALFDDDSVDFSTSFKTTKRPA